MIQKDACIAFLYPVRLPLSIEGKAASFMGAERQLENTNFRSKNMERYCPIIFSHPAE